MDRLGSRQSGIRAKLTEEWLPGGPAICYLAGFSGIGKTTVGRAVVSTATNWQAIEVEVPLGGEPMAGLLEVIGEELELRGTEVSPIGASFLRDLELILTSEQLLLVVDEAQRLLSYDRFMDANIWPLLQRLGGRSRCRGRILFLGNISPEETLWRERHILNVLGHLEPSEGERVLSSFLAEMRAPPADPEELRIVSRWLGGNPRALKAISVLLQYEPLNDLLTFANRPRLSGTDATPSPHVIAALEREFTERVLDRLPLEARQILRQLSVHRVSFERSVFDAVAGRDSYKILTKLVSQFLIELDPRSWYRVTPVARELSLAELRRDANALRIAHANAGFYYARHFTGQQLTGSRLGQMYAEARHHLVAGEQQEILAEIVRSYSGHIRQRYSANTRVPADSATRTEQAAELGPLLDQPFDWQLHFYFVRLLQAQGVQDERILEQCAYGLELRPRDAHLWLIRIGFLEDQGHIDQALSALELALANVPPTQNLFALYQAGIELRSRHGDLDAAVRLLDEGTQKVPETHGRYVLYLAGLSAYARHGDPGTGIKIALAGMESLPRENRDRVAEAILYTAYGMVVRGRHKEAGLVWWDELDKRYHSGSPLRHLSSVCRLVSLGKWEEAHLLALEWRRTHPVNLALLGQEVLCSLGADNVEGAAEAISIYNDLSGRSKRNANRTAVLRAWLVALCYDAQGRQEEAWRVLGDQWGEKPGPGGVVGACLRIWMQEQVQESSGFGIRISFHFPRLPETVFEKAYRAPDGSPMMRTASEVPTLAAEQPESEPLISPQPTDDTANRASDSAKYDRGEMTTLLFLAANPGGSGKLALDREYREVDSALRSAGLRENVELVSAWAVRVRDLQTALLRYRPNIVHFAGHGTRSDGIVLADTGMTVTGEALAHLLRAVGKEVRLVVLNACWSGEQADALAPVVGCVVGMRRPIVDEAAIEFAQSFYEAIAYGIAVQHAFDAAIARLALLRMNDGPVPGEDLMDSANPKLVVGRGIDPKELRLVQQSR